MTLVDRYWEWKRRRAMRAQDRANARAALVGALMERRCVWRCPDRRDQKPPVGESDAASAQRDHGSSRGVREGPLSLKHAGSDQSSAQQTEWETQKTADVPGRDTSGYSTILVAIDGSKSSAQAGRHAVDLAKSLQAVLVVLSVINVELALRTGIHRTLALAELERDSWVVARQTKELADESGVECEGWSAWDPRPSWAVAGVAEEVKADCIVIGSPGPRPWIACSPGRSGERTTRSSARPDVPC